MATQKINNIPLDQLPGFAQEQPKEVVVGRAKKAAIKPAINEATQSKIDKQLERMRATRLSKKATAANDAVAKAAINSGFLNLGQRVLQMEFPLWDDETRGAPNALIRSGLFSVNRTVSRTHLSQRKIATIGKTEIEYEGAELQQDDFSVWLSLINFARVNPMSEHVWFTGYEIVRDLGMSMNSRSYEAVKRSIHRLKVTGLTIKSADGKQGYTGSLIRDYLWDASDPNDGKVKWRISFEPTVATLFQPDETTFYEWEVRKKIGAKSSVALWLGMWYSSHRQAFPYKTATLHELCKSADTVSSFRRSLRVAHERLVEVGFLTGFEHNEERDLWSVTKADLLLNQNKPKRLSAKK